MLRSSPYNELCGTKHTYFFLTVKNGGFDTLKKCKYSTFHFCVKLEPLKILLLSQNSILECVGKGLIRNAFLWYVRIKTLDKKIWCPKLEIQFKDKGGNLIPTKGGRKKSPSPNGQAIMVLTPSLEVNDHRTFL